MEHIVNNPALDHIEVAILCWASENSPFSLEAISNRFPNVLDAYSGHFLGKALSGLTEQFYLHKEIEPSGAEHYSYIPPPDAPDIPKLFTEFCHNYKQAGGRVSSIPYCWGRMKKHKGYKNYLKLLSPALDAQIADRERKKQRGVFLADWRLLETWINKRGWEDLVSDDVVSTAPVSPELQLYRNWVASKYGATAQAPLSDPQYMSFLNGTEAFSRIKTLLSKDERSGMFERAHSYYFNGMTAGLSCYDYLVKLFRNKSE